MSEHLKSIKGLCAEVLAAAVLLAVTLVVLTQPVYTVLFKDMNSRDAGEVLTVLRDMGVPARARGAGTVLVPAKQADRLRMQLAEQGFPKSGFNYDVFVQGTGFGTTEYEKRIYERFQKEVRLQNTLQLYDGIEQVVVTLAIPDVGEESFETGDRSASASVMLCMKPEMELTDEQIESIVLLVANSVENLLPENVSITDNFFRRINSPEQ